MNHCRSRVNRFMPSLSLRWFYKDRDVEWFGHWSSFSTLKDFGVEGVDILRYYFYKWNEPPTPLIHSTFRNLYHGLYSITSIYKLQTTYGRSSSSSSLLPSSISYRSRRLTRRRK